jgi:hypothetical protein
MASAHEDSTAEQYGRHWRTFCEWCALSSTAPLPATQRMVAAYIGYLAERGTIAAGSLQPYLSAINSVHHDHGYERPALGHLVQRARQGMARGQALVQTRDVRVPLPSDAIAGMIADAVARAPQQRAALSLRAYVEWLRRRYATCLGFVFFGRQDSCVSLLAGDHGVDAGDAGGFLWLRLTEKMKRGSIFRRVIRLPLDSPPVRGHASLLPQLAALGRLYVLAREAVSPGGDDAAAAPYLFQLPGEPRPLTRHMAAWVSTSLEEMGVEAPSGFVYLGHSLRSGGSSAAEAIGVSRYRGNWLGGWSQTGRTREVHYIDPSVRPTASAYGLLGWLLEGSFMTDMGGWERSAGARDCDEPGEPV